jgi:NADP-dependent aldehyde dehydrogenase
LKKNADAIATGLYASFTLGAGQFCTKPGMVFLPQNSSADNFINRLRASVQESEAFTLLTSTIHSSYCKETAERKNLNGVRVLAEKTIPAGPQFNVGAALFETDASAFLRDAGLASEIFGPSTLIVRDGSRDQLLQIARNMEGHLTATIHGTEDDLREFSDLIAILEDKVGRIIFNGFPTGVEVSHAIVHGGPYPATSDGRSTSVGTNAIFRFTRLICYQNFPESALPSELKDENPLQIWRMVDGEMTRSAIGQPLEAGVR